MKDLIERQAAINALKKHEIELPIYAPRETDVFWDDAIDCCISEIEALPSAQPEIIRYKDCKYGVHAGCGNTYLCVVSPENRLEHKYDFWCAYAERRRDEQTN